MHNFSYVYNMIELILIAVCSWQLYKLAEQRLISGWKWIGYFISGYLLFGVVLSLMLIVQYGVEMMRDYEIIKEKLTPWLPYTLLFLVMWFTFIRSRIMKYEQPNEGDADDNYTNPPEEEKKDLSYFR